MNFGDDEYYKKVFGNTKDKVNPKLIKLAHKLANQCRDREIDRSWERGKYFWAFILGSYTAHFYILNVIGKENLLLDNFVNVSFFLKVLLLITSFLGVFFCFSWVLINKGSKFWQKNWEEHVNLLEDKVVGKLYKTYLETNNKSFSTNIFNKNPYDFSVSKITYFGSVLLTVVAGFLFLYETVMCFYSFEIQNLLKNKDCIKFIIFVLFIVFVFVVLYLLFFKSKGNVHNDCGNKWYQKN